MQDQKLMDYFKFTEADLEANRNGCLSKKQKNTIVKRRSDFKSSGIKYSVILIAVSLGIALVDWGISIIQNAPHPDTGALITAGVIFVLGVLLLWLTLSSESGNTNASKDVVKKDEGPVNIVKVERTRSGATEHSPLEHYFAYELHVGDKAFDVDENLANIMTQNDEYAIYYDNFNNKVLSVELVSKTK
ncbi:MAG: hypothetical protein M1282_09405 [Chloroflexi bacterium]|nr:hypothetical protein [Chloroflexota bacterium]